MVLMNLEYPKYLVQAKALNGDVVVRASCSGGYSWQIVTSAFAYKSYYSAGSFSDAGINISRKIQLISPDGKTVVEGGGFGDESGEASLHSLAPFVRAALSPEISASYGQYYTDRRLRGILLVASAGFLSEQDFSNAADCFDANYATLNSNFIAKAAPDRVSGNDPIKGIILANDNSISKTRIGDTEFVRSSLKREYPKFICEDGNTVFSVSTAYIGPTISMLETDETALTIVGFDGRVGSARIPGGPTDDILSRNVEAMKTTIFSQRCVDEKGRDLKTVIVSLPSKITYFKNTNVNSQNTQTNLAATPIGDITPDGIMSSGINMVKSQMTSTVGLSAACNNFRGSIISGNALTGMCSAIPGNTWPKIDVCGPNIADTKWTVFNGDSAAWNITLTCKNFDKCNGPANALCDKDGCVFAGTCR
jgi:hypothetical protein